MTAIPPELLAAYRETGYHVGGDAPFVLRIGESSPLLLRLHALHRVRCSAFITAANPHSLRCGAAVNARRQRQLAAQLRRTGLVFMAGEGRHPTNGWPAEASFLVLGLARRAAEKLAARWGQNALVFCADDAIPRLLPLTCGQAG